MPAAWVERLNGVGCDIEFCMRYGCGSKEETPQTTGFGPCFLPKTTGVGLFFLLYTSIGFLGTLF